MPDAFDSDASYTRETAGASMTNLWMRIGRWRQYCLRRWPRVSQFGEFCAVGASGVVVDLTVFALLQSQLPATAARGLAIAVAMTWNFLLNRAITFADAGRGSILVQFVGFCLSCSVGAAVNWSLSVWLWTSFPVFAAHKSLAAFLGVVAGTGFNFLLCRYAVFRQRRPEGATESCE